MQGRGGTTTHTLYHLHCGQRLLQICLQTTIRALFMKIYVLPSTEAQTHPGQADVAIRGGRCRCCEELSEAACTGVQKEGYGRLFRLFFYKRMRSRAHHFAF